MRTAAKEAKAGIDWRKIVGLTLFAGLMLMALALANSGRAAIETPPPPSVWSDKADYAPGETVTLSGANWAAGESVHIRVNDDAGQTWSRDVDVNAAADGTISDQFNLPNWFVAQYNVTATGASSGTATWSFTDGNLTSVTGNVTDSSTSLALSGVTVSCTSGCNAPASTTTNASGNYAFDSTTTRLSFAGNGPATLTLTFSKTGYTSGAITLSGVNNGDSFANKNIALVPSDSIAPTTTATPSPAANGAGWNNATVSVSLSATDNVGGSGVKEITYSATGAQTIASTTISGNSVSGISLTTEGVTTLSFFAKDNAGNTESAKTLVVRIDKTAPETSITANPSNPSNSSSASFSYTGSDLGGSGVASFECKLDGAAFAACTSPQSYSGLSDGPHTFQVRAKDAAGNVDASPASFTWVVDTTAPNTTIDTHPADPTNSSSASFTFSGTDGSGSGVASFECKLDGGSFAVCSSPQSYSSLSDGPHTFQVRAIDAVGNVDATPASFTWVIDTQAPTLTASAVKGTAPDFDDAVSYAANSWTNQDVKVDFTCSDNAGGSGVAPGSPTAASQTFTTEGVYSASSDCSDNAGNSVSESSGVKIDKTPPTITATITPAPNAAGWNNSDVTVSYTCTDALSGVTGCPSDVPVSDEGLTTVHRGISDNAGNVAENDSTVLIDKGKPSSSATSPAYNNDAVIDVSYSASDARSGVKRVDLYAKAPGEAAFTLVMSDVAGVGSGIDHAFAYSVPTLGGPTDYVQGTYRFYTRATDVADNVEDAPATPDSASAQTLEDSIAPDTSITSHPSDPSNSSSASFSFAYTDASPSSGLKRFECKLDAGSFTTCSSPQSYSSLGEGSHTFQVRAVDNADNTGASPASFTWVVDTLAPSLAASHTADGANGWNMSDPVTVTVSASDSGSGLDGDPSCTVDSSAAVLTPGGSDTWTLSVTGEGTHAVHCSVSDLAGNGQTASDTVKIDTVKPVISGSQSPAANSDGWNKSDVTVGFTCADGGASASGVDVNSVAGATLTHEGRNQSVTNTGVCKDKAGNVADSATVSGIKIDKTGPNAPSGHTDHGPEYTSSGTNWFKDSVTVSFTDNGDPDLEDLTAGSGVASVTEPATFSSAGSFSKTGKATDRAGNYSVGTTVSGNVDTEKPVVALTCPGSVILGSTASGSWTASDPGTASEASGIAPGVGSGSITLDTSTVGSHTASVPANASKDNVGHFSAASSACSYTVNYNFTGFFAPVDNNDVCNVVKAGQAVPIKFSLHGYQGMNIFASGYPQATAGTCAGAALDAVEETVTAGGSTLNYDFTSDQYIYVWKTDKAWAGKAIRFTIKFADGSYRYARFTFTK